MFPGLAGLSYKEKLDHFFPLDVEAKGYCMEVCKILKGLVR